SRNRMRGPASTTRTGGPAGDNAPPGSPPRLPRTPGSGATTADQVASFLPRPRNPLRSGSPSGRGKEDTEHMAEKVIRVDDIDGSEGDDVVKRDFEVLGRTFTIDLSEDNYKRLNETLDALAPFIENVAEVK